MTEIDTSKASREFDLWIAQNVIGIKNLFADGSSRFMDLPMYTLLHHAAWKVVEAMPRFKLRATIAQNDDGYTVELWHPNGKSAYPGYAEGDNVPLAICQAAYAALTKAGIGS